MKKFINVPSKYLMLFVPHVAVLCLARVICFLRLGDHIELHYGVIYLYVLYLEACFLLLTKYAN